MSTVAKTWDRQLFPTEEECRRLAAAAAAAEKHLVDAAAAVEVLAVHFPRPGEVALLARDLGRLRRQVADIAEEVAL